MGTDRGGHVIVPVAGTKPSGLIGKDAGGTDVNKIPGERRLKLSFFNTSVIDSTGAAHDSEISASSKFLIETNAAVALDAAVHFMLNLRSQILIHVGTFSCRYSAAGHGRRRW